VRKRIFDLAIATPVFAAALPLMGATGLAVRLSMGPGVFFRQERPGLHGRPFTMLKFKTMTNVRGPDGELLPDSERLTRLGKLLRATSLDELPELTNVLVGDMSLVGPRPLLMRYLDRYTPEQARRHEVRPGITGWAQVNGRNTLGWEDKFELDVWYVDNQSLLLDLKILALTALKVVQREGISEDGGATMTEFGGTSKRPST
jgi:lipopolysaccharide/colanic/teichoic acid biosynthesis glycosyltransferase